MTFDRRPPSLREGIKHPRLNNIPPLAVEEEPSPLDSLIQASLRRRRRKLLREGYITDMGASRATL